ncbi:rCG45053, partial [Rattus norvegicus]
VSPNPGWPP